MTAIYSESNIVKLIATLPANQTTYTDNDIRRIGTYRYFLSPQRSSGFSITDMREVIIGPECSAAGTGVMTSLSLLMVELTTQEAYDGVYCYVSVNGSRYERLPAGMNLLRPTRGELGYELPLQLPNRGRYALTVPNDGLVRLEGECWGRRGAQSLRIGRFSGSHARSEWDGRDLTSELLAFEPRELASAAGLPARAGASFLRYRVYPASMRPDLSNIPADPGALQTSNRLAEIMTRIPGLLDVPVRLNPVVPAPTNVRRVTSSPLCLLPLPGLCEALQLPPSIEWDWAENSFYRERDLTGWRMDVTYIQVGSDGSRQEIPGQSIPVIYSAGTPVSRRAPYPYIPSPYACGTKVHITVTAYTADGNSSLPSAPLELPAVACPSADNVQIRLESISVLASDHTGRAVDDGDICAFCADQRFELQGFPGGFEHTFDHHTAFSRRFDRITGNMMTIGAIMLPSSVIGNPIGPLLIAAATVYRVGEGIAVFFGACPIEHFCVFYEKPFVHSTLLQTGTINNSLRELSLIVWLKDTDILNAPDDFCLGHVRVPAPSSWNGFDQRFTIVSDYGEAKCEVVLHVQGGNSTQR